MLLTLGSFVVVLGVLVFVHELGHFLVAKAVGVQVLRFSLGFGRPLISFRRGETEYWISWIPLGGYVKMAGLEEEGMVGELEGGKADASIDPARTFDRKPLWARMAVILAGVAMNILLAFVIYAGLGAFVGLPRLATTQVDTVAAPVPPGAEALSTLHHGDRIVRIAGDTVKTWQDIVEKLIRAPRADVPIEIAGRSQPVVLHLPASDTVARALVARALIPLMPARVGIVYPGQPAAKAGLKPGDVIVRAGNDTVRSWNEMLQKIWNSPGKPLDLTVLRGGGDSLVRLTVTPEPHTETDSTSPRPRTYGLIGALQDPPTVRERVGLGTALASAVDQLGGQLSAVVGSVTRLLTGRASVKEVGGPILIYKMSGQVARLGIDWFLNFLAFFSVSLAVLNLLPIPVLDGGHLMFLIVEGIRRRPLTPQLRARLTQIGMLIVLAIIALAISNDVLFH